MVVKIVQLVFQYLHWINKWFRNRVVLILTILLKTCSRMYRNTNPTLYFLQSVPRVAQRLLTGSESCKSPPKSIMNPPKHLHVNGVPRWSFVSSREMRCSRSRGNWAACVRAANDEVVMPSITLESKSVISHRETKNFI